MHRKHLVDNKPIPTAEKLKAFFGDLDKSKTQKAWSRFFTKHKLTNLPDDNKQEITKLAQSFTQLLPVIARTKDQEKKSALNVYLTASFDLAVALTECLLHESKNNNRHHNFTLIAHVKKLIALLRFENLITLYHAAKYACFPSFFDLHESYARQYKSLFDNCILRLQSINQSSFYNDTVYRALHKSDTNQKHAQVALTAIIVLCLAVTIGFLCINAPFIIPLVIAGIAAMLIATIAYRRMQNDKIFKPHKLGATVYHKSVAFFKGDSIPILKRSKALDKEKREKLEEEIFLRKLM